MGHFTNNSIRCGRRPRFLDANGVPFLILHRLRLVWTWPPSQPPPPPRRSPSPGHGRSILPLAGSVEVTVWGSAAGPSETRRGQSGLVVAQGHRSLRGSPAAGDAPPSRRMRPFCIKGFYPPRPGICSLQTASRREEAVGGENFLMRGEEGEARPGTNWKQGYQRGKSLPGGQRGLRAVSLSLSYRPDRYLPQCLPGFAPAVSKAPRDGSGKR